MLHVTNGSIAMMRIHDLGLGGTVLPWDDVLHEGPVPHGLDTAALRAVRAAYLSSANWGDTAEIARRLEHRDATLEAAHTDEVVLWFEHDLYDQLQLLQVLDRLAARVLPSSDLRVTAILADDYLAAQLEGQLRSWFAARQPLTSRQWDAAATAWRGFGAADPMALAAFAHAGAWPALTASIRRHLQQFPAIENGLSRSERQTLAALATGPRPVRDLFVAANHGVEQANFMGDAGWWLHIRPLLASRHPLLQADGPAPSTLADPLWWRDDEQAPRLALTADGERVLANQADHVALNGVDRWLGGVHLSGATAAWRWNEQRATLQPR